MTAAPPDAAAGGVSHGTSIKSARSILRRCAHGLDNPAAMRADQELLARNEYLAVEKVTFTIQSGSSTISKPARASNLRCSSMC